VKLDCSFDDALPGLLFRGRALAEAVLPFRYTSMCN